MGKNKQMEEVQNIMVDTANIDLPLVEVEKEVPTSNHTIVNKSLVSSKEEKQLINCLTNTRITVKHVPKATGLISNPKHILYGGMAENAIRTYVVPRYTSGMFMNVLTDSEKVFLEHIMGLEENALSVYKKVDNFWDDATEGGISKVRLTKQDNYLNLSDPEDYIRYKILLANKNFIAPSLDALHNNRKATYQFVLINEGEENKNAADNMNNTMKCYKEFGRIESDVDKLKLIIEILDARPLSVHTKIDFIKAKINELIQADSKLFLSVALDPLLDTKVLIRRCVEAGLISKRGNFLYLTNDGSPLCDHNEEPTLNMAAKYINTPRRQEIKFMLEAKLKQ